jgi:hypothetical protein
MGVRTPCRKGMRAMASERYWDVTGCCWKACHDRDPGSASSSLDADMAVLAGTTPATTPPSTGAAATGVDAAAPANGGPAAH